MSKVLFSFLTLLFILPENGHSSGMRTVKPIQEMSFEDVKPGKPMVDAEYTLTGESIKYSGEESVMKDTLLESSTPEEFQKSLQYVVLEKRYAFEGVTTILIHTLSLNLRVLEAADTSTLVKLFETSSGSCAPEPDSGSDRDTIDSLYVKQEEGVLNVSGDTGPNTEQPNLQLIIPKGINFIVSLARNSSATLPKITGSFRLTLAEQASAFCDAIVNDTVDVNVIGEGHFKMPYLEVDGPGFFTGAIKNKVKILSGMNLSCTDKHCTLG